jgi:hypothetical protein
LTVLYQRGKHEYRHNDFSIFALVVASASAAGCLTIANMLSTRFNV